MRSLSALFDFRGILRTIVADQVQQLAIGQEAGLAGAAVQPRGRVADLAIQGDDCGPRLAIRGQFRLGALRIGDALRIGRPGQPAAI